MKSTTLVLSKSIDVLEGAYLYFDKGLHFYSMEQVAEYFYDEAISELCEFTAHLDDADVEEIACHSAITEYDFVVTPYMVDERA